MKTENRPENEAAVKKTVAIEMRQVLDDEFQRFYPASLDTVYGGYLSDFNYRWELDGRQDKMIVTQARHVWSLANAARFYNRDNSYTTMAGHGLKFFQDTMWDTEFGGFYDLVDRQGEPINENGQIIKRAYGNAFAIYGLAAYYATSGDSAALRLAQQTFQWLDRHSYDPQYGGYFQFMARDGTPLTEGFRGTPPKDYNSLIHLLECLTELYKIWPDAKVKERLTSTLHIIRDTLTTEQGYMRLYFTRDWTHVSYRDSSAEVRQRNYQLDHVSFGHDVETAYLMLEASEALGLGHDAATLRVAKKMADHALSYGWDQERGGLYDGGYYLDGEDRPTIVRNTKEWWSQAEALNSLLMMSELFPNDEQHYYEKFLAQWDYCKKYVIDSEHGGWYWGGVDIVPDNKISPKSSIWKGNYHTSRALINCLYRLKRGTITQGQPRFEPANKNTTPEARKLLEYLHSISGKKILAGQHNYVDRIDIYPNRVKELTGKLPAVWGCDFIQYYMQGVADKIVEEAYKKHKDGYIITLMWHAGRPQDDPPFGWRESVQAKMTDAQWQELITPGTNLHSRWLGQVDSVAVYLSKLQALGVPVIWRPYHELNGVWFWWGNRKGESGSAKLYRMMFDRYVNHHKLNNLIWVWNTNAPRQLVNDEAWAYEDFFPGHEYVDVLGADIYHNDYRQSHHDELVELGQGKPLALAEVGNVPTPEILAQQPRWTWFMIWGNFVNSHNTPQQIRDLYNYPGIVTHNDYIHNK